MYEPKELKDTVDLMLSQDYKERFQAEYYQAKIRYDKLRAMTKKWDEGNLPFTPTCPRLTYEMQLKNQRESLALLVTRAKIEGVPVVEPTDD